MKLNIRLLYLYLFSFVGLLITVIGGIQIVDLGLKTYVFQVQEVSYPVSPMLDEKGREIQSVEEQRRMQKQESENQKKRQLSSSLAMIAIGIPLYLYHWKTIKKENK